MNFITLLSSLLLLLLVQTSLSFVTTRQTSGPLLPGSSSSSNTANTPTTQQQKQNKQQHRRHPYQHPIQNSPDACNYHYYSDAVHASDESTINNRHSARDWLYNVRSIPQSAVLREIRHPVLAVAGWSTLVSIVQKVCSHAVTVPWMQRTAHNMCIPGTAHGFLVSALGLLLVFRTNSAYQRFYEGRKIWENILSISRNFSRMIQLYDRDVGADRVARILNLVAAYPYLLRHHIRPGCLCEESKESIADPKYRFELQEAPQAPVETRHDGDKTRSSRRKVASQQICQPVLIQADASPSSTPPQRSRCWVDRRKLPWSLFDIKNLQKIGATHNRPLWVCDRIGREIVDIPYSPNFTSRERLSLLGQVEKLTNAIGQCERIHQTAVPLNYARHSLRSLTLWLFTLPFALVKDLGLLTGPVTACIAWLLLGVYQIGYSIEDPFQGSLRLSILCDAIRRDVIGDATTTRTTTAGAGSQYEPRDSAFSLTWEDTDHDRFHLDEEYNRYQLSADMQRIFDAPRIVQDGHGHWNVVSLATTTTKAPSPSVSNQ
jgi:predicted membrane chloride channel (bestrophin family)